MLLFMLAGNDMASPYRTKKKKTKTRREIGNHLGFDSNKLTSASRGLTTKNDVAHLLFRKTLRKTEK